jgi:4-amino-4-deoxy-L-arabinose transferase-like glycosyltransferase
LPRPRLTAQSIVLLCAIAAAVIVGTYVRLWLLGNQGINSDEATVGLMAHQIVRGHFSTFYWGQSYGGGEPYIVAAAFGVFGQSAFMLNFAPALLAVAAALVVWRIGLRLFSPWCAVAAAALTWVWGEAEVWNSVREIGFRGVTLLLGLLIVLLALRIRSALVHGDRPLVELFLVGLCAGAGWWCSPEIVYFAVPSAVFLALALYRHRVRGSWIALGAALLGLLLGSAPWLVATVTRGGTFKQASSPVDYFGRLQLFFTHAAPIALGVRVEGAGAWITSPWLSVTVLLFLAVATVAAVGILWRDEAGRLLVLILVLFPFLYAGFSATSFWNDARYVAYLPPILALAWLGALWKVAERHAPALASVVLVVAVVSTLVSFNDGYGALNSTSALTSFKANPNTALTALSDHLVGAKVKDALAQYWVANDLGFISGGRVLALDPDSLRNAPASAAQLASAEKTWIFVNPDDLAASESALGVPGQPSPGGLSPSQVEAWAAAHGVSVKTTEVGPFIVAQFGRSVSIADVT